MEILGKVFSKKYLCNKANTLSAMIKHISSVQNPLIKQILQLQEKSRERKKTGLFIIEGEREISLAAKGGYEIEKLLYSKEIYSEDVLMHLINHPIDRVEITMEVYKRIAYRQSTEGLIAVARTKKNLLSDLKLSSKTPLILVIEAPEKPGNIGALLRTADAARIDAVLIANPKTDIYNPNIIRSSIGCVFTTPIATGTTDEIVNSLKENKITIYAAALQASTPYETVDYKGATAIVMGTEDTGLSAQWLKQATKNIVIPMEGEIDSMNVSVAAAILIFEAKRQRKAVTNL